MKNFFIKPYRWAVVFSLLLTITFSYVLLDTFVIPKELAAVEQSSTAAAVTSSGAATVTGSAIQAASTSAVTSAAFSESASSGTASAQSTASQQDPVVTDNSYDDGNIKITIDTLQKYNSTIYIADIQVSDASYLKTAFANDAFGRNIKETTSDTAETHNAILAVNGDYYGFRNAGYVLRNGTLYRDTASSGTEALVIDNSGNFSIISESETSVSSLDTGNIAQILSFGPALLEDGKIMVDSSSEVSQSKNSNPRTAIGQVSALHYVFIVSDGRTSESTGLSLLELAQVFQDYGCSIAYNLDGGGSSTMYFNGEVVNNPTDGKKMGERKVSDIVYIGY